LIERVNRVPDASPSGSTAWGKLVPEKIVVVRNLSKRYGKKPVVNDVSFEVDRGEFFAIMGPSPCGKTTILRCIAGLERPDSGEIFIDGNNMRGIPAYRRNISLVFQNFALFPHMKVAANVSFGLRMMGVDEKDINERLKDTMALVGLEGLGDRYPRELSGGQQQRVALARSLMVRPEILLMDEPLGNLDYKLQQKMQLELKMIQEKLGQTCIYVTHSRDQALTLADRIMVLNRGAAEQLGTPHQLYEHPRSLFVAKFVGDLNVLGGHLTSVSNNVGTVENEVGRFGGRLESDRPGEKLERKIAYTLRPEWAYIGEDAKECDNTVQAKLVETVYKGSDCIYIAVLANGVEFKVVKHGRRIVRLKAKPGDEISLGWNSEKALIIDKPSEIPRISMESLMPTAQSQV